MRRKKFSLKSPVVQVQQVQQGQPKQIRFGDLNPNDGTRFSLGNGRVFEKTGHETLRLVSAPKGQEEYVGKRSTLSSDYLVTVL